MSNTCQNCHHWQTSNMTSDGLAAPCSLDRAPWTTCSFHHSCSRHHLNGEQAAVAAPTVIAQAVLAPINLATAVKARPAVKAPQPDLFGA
jgi:hypothetical protein